MKEYGFKIGNSYFHQLHNDIRLTNPVIVISAFERLHSLKRLLISLEKALVAITPKIFIVVGKKEDNFQVIQHAKKFVEKFNNAELILPSEKMSLVEQYYFVGDNFSKEDFIILEDDLWVSDSFYHFASEALSHYSQDEKIAGICLSSMSFNGYTKFPFIPIDDGTDVYYAQIPFYHGQAFTSKMWHGFKNWLERNENPNWQTPHLPHVFRSFPLDEYFPIMTLYLIESQKYFVFPRISYSVNFGDIGRHFNKTTSLFQFPLAHKRNSFSFGKFSTSISVYDVYQELLPEIFKKENPMLKDFEFIVDINGGRSVSELDNIPDETYLLTTKPCKNKVNGFSNQMKPLEENVLSSMNGEFISLCRYGSLSRKLCERKQIAKLSSYFYPYHGMGYAKRLLNRIIAVL